MAPSRDTDIEGRLMAHRKLLVRLIDMLPPAQRDELADWLASASQMHDGQEDPGAVEDPAAALQLAEADEIRLLSDRLHLRLGQSQTG